MSRTKAGLQIVECLFVRRSPVGQFDSHGFFQPGEALAMALVDFSHLTQLATQPAVAATSMRESYICSNAEMNASRRWPG
jgi:hypothetical protein